METLKPICQQAVAVTRTPGSEVIQVSPSKYCSISSTNRLKLDSKAASGRAAMRLAGSTAKPAFALMAAASYSSLQI